MFYEFPEGLTRSEVKAVIMAHNARTDTNAFIEADRDDHVIFNYLVAFSGSFPQPDTDDEALNREYAILRECRGLIMCKTTGMVLARRYHKFFNINEKDFTQAHLIDWSVPHVILEKLDGSMITPFSTPYRTRWGTKMGATDVALPIEQHVLDYDAVLESPKKGYFALVDACRIAKITPIFEWCTRKQKIVIDYPKDELVLTGVRSNDSGAYMPYRTMKSFAELYGVPVVRALPGSVENVEAFMAEAKDLEGAEGYIIRFDNGHMLKVKGAWYCQIHKTKDMLQFEKDVWKLILEERMDDALGFMDAADRDRVERFVAAFEQQIEVTADRLAAKVVDGLEATAGDKKRYAMEIACKEPAAERGLLFAIWDGNEPKDVVRTFLKKNMFTQNKINAVRGFVNDLTWDDYRDRTLVLDD